MASQSSAPAGKGAAIALAPRSTTEIWSENAALAANGNVWGAVRAPVETSGPLRPL
jgi:hypothetical protein